MNWIKKIKELGLTPVRGNCFAPLSKTDIQKIENFLRVKFPEDYRLFLLCYGASDFEEWVVFPTQDGEVAPGTFFGNDIEEAITDYKERLPKLMIPINDDGANNLICICLRPEDFGAIYFQSHSVGWENTSDPNVAKLETCFRLSDNFPSFICGLEIK